MKAKRTRLDVKSLSIDQMVEQYYGVRKQLLELELEACRGHLPTYSSQKRFLRKEIARLTMFIEEFEKKERMSNLLKSLGVEINSNKEGAGVHGS